VNRLYSLLNDDYDDDDDDDNNNNNNNNNNITNDVEPEMYDYTSYDWSQWNGNEKLKEKPGKSHILQCKT
jgi:hypothetical protein